jgi:hypothetical protein
MQLAVTGIRTLRIMTGIMHFLLVHCRKLQDDTAGVRADTQRLNLLAPNASNRPHAPPHPRAWFRFAMPVHTPAKQPLFFLINYT